jgi:anti-sigma B factor antagonist
MAKILHEQGVIIVELEPSYDSVEFEPLQKLSELLLGEVSRVERPLLVLDMAQTRYIDSMFIETVFRVWKRVKERRGAMALCCANDVCTEIVRITRLDDIWPIFRTRAEAIALVKAET